MPKPNSRSSKKTKPAPGRSTRNRTTDVKIRMSNQVEQVAVDIDWLKDLTRYALAAEKMDRAEISVALVDDATIHRLNREFLNHDFPTDVITFPFARGKILEGEIVIGLEYAAHEAPDFGWTTLEETGLYLVHGILHLCDYDDSDEDQAEIMKERQEELLHKFIAERGLPTAETGSSPSRRKS